jgi:hypothetical protein
MMEAARTSETSVYLYQTTRRYNPEDSHIRLSFFLTVRSDSFVLLVLFSGAIFTEDQKDSSTELAFKYAVYRINKDKHILPRTTLVYDIQYVPRDDSFHASKKGRNVWVRFSLC